MSLRMSSLVFGQLGPPPWPWPCQSQQGFLRSTKLQEAFTTAGTPTYMHTHAPTHMHFCRSWGLSTSLSTDRGGRVHSSHGAREGCGSGPVFRKMPRQLLTDILSETQRLHGGNFKKVKTTITVVSGFCEGTTWSLYLNLAVVVFFKPCYFIKHCFSKFHLWDGLSFFIVILNVSSSRVSF